MNMPLPTTHALRIDHDLVLPLVPVEARESVLLLWQLDARLGELARRRGEPALAQIRLRWWADQLSKGHGLTSSPDPLLAKVANSLQPRLTAAPLVACAEGWMAAVADGGNGARGAALFDATANLIGWPRTMAVLAAGNLWSDVDAMMASGDVKERGVRPMLSQLPRSLAVLANDAHRVASRQGHRHARRDQLAILRVGLLGR